MMQKGKFRIACRGSTYSKSAYLAPWVSEELVNRVTLLRVDIEKMCDEVLGWYRIPMSVSSFVNHLTSRVKELTRCRDVVPPRGEESVVTLRDLLRENVNRLVVERRETTEESVKDTTEGPHIDRFRIPLVLDDFRSRVTDSSTRSHRLLVPHDLRETEICDLDSSDSSSTNSG